MRISADIYLDLESRLIEEHPEDVSEAQKLAGKVTDVSTASCEEVWSALWDKPLFANTRVEIGVRWCEVLRPYMPAAWQRWSDESGGFQISKTGKGLGRTSFSVAGDIAVEVAENTRIALYRLFAIQGAARATYKRSDLSDTPYRDLKDRELATNIVQLREEFGVGWGPVSVLHFLTDLGLAVKPDLHLVRTVRYLSGCAEEQSSRVLALSDAVDVNRAVVSLMAELGRANTPQNLRYMDKVLMEVSRRNII